MKAATAFLKAAENHRHEPDFPWPACYHVQRMVKWANAKMAAAPAAGTGPDSAVHALAIDGVRLFVNIFQCEPTIYRTGPGHRFLVALFEAATVYANLGQDQGRSRVALLSDQRVFNLLGAVRNEALATRAGWETILARISHHQPRAASSVP